MKTAVKSLPKAQAKPVLALLIAAHDEELVIEQTINSAIKAGMDPVHIYVVDDSSKDNTRRLAVALLGKSNVMRVARSGKGLALAKGAKENKKHAAVTRESI